MLLPAGRLLPVVVPPIVSGVRLHRPPGLWAQTFMSEETYRRRSRTLWLALSVISLSAYVLALWGFHVDENVVVRTTEVLARYLLAFPGEC